MDNFSFDEDYLQNTQLVLTEENNELIRQPKIATEETLQALLTATSAISGTTPFTLIKMDYDGSGNLIYKGQNTDVNALDADTDWSIIKYVYDGDNLSQKITKAGAWSNRTNLF